MHTPSAGTHLRTAIAQETPLQCVGTVNAYHALLAQACGYHALYLSGGGVAASSLGVPDLGISTLEDVLTDLRRITDITDLPVLVDIDTGWGEALNIAHCIHNMIKCGAAAVHIEDQVQQKRCGHRPNKALVSRTEMVDRIKAAVDARTDEAFVIMARTDALANEGLQAAIDRAGAYIEAGADMIFPEAVDELKVYQQFADTLHVPVLANITEFGFTPLFTLEELASANVSIALYPLSAFRAASLAALNVYKTIRQEGTQQGIITNMQSREQLYEILGYHAYEQKLDALLKKQ